MTTPYLARDSIRVGMYRRPEQVYYSHSENYPPHYGSYQQPEPFFHHPQHSEREGRKYISPYHRRRAPTHTSVVGQPGYPEPSLPCLEKAPFTAADNAKLKDLKERTDPNLTWRQIGDFFPGRSFNTLQVHYCTKIKGINVTWTAELDRQLRAAVRDDEAGKGKRVAKTMGTMVTPEECEARMKHFKEIAEENGTSDDSAAPASTTEDRTTVGDGASDRVGPQPAHSSSPKGEEHHSEPSAADSFQLAKRRRIESLGRPFVSTRDESGQSSAFWKIV